MVQLTKNRWIVCLTTALFFFFEFFQVNMFNALDVYLMRDLQIDGAKLSWISSAYFYGVILLLLPAGFILDRYSPRMIILSTMLTSIAGTGIFSVSHSFLQASFGRFIVGVTAGPFAFLAVLKVASRWFKNSELAFISGLIVSIGMLAGIVAQAPFTAMVELVGWREALAVNIVVGLIIFGILFWIISDSPEQKYCYVKGENLFQLLVTFWENLKQAIQIPSNWAVGIFASLTNLPIFLLGALWNGLYLTQAHGFSRPESSYITIMLYLGMLVGSAFFGFLSDRLERRKTPMLFGGTLCLIAVLIVMHLDDDSILNFMLWFFIMGFGASAHILAYASIAESNPKEHMAQSEGLAATLIMSGGAVFQPLLGMLIKQNWNGRMVDQIPLYSPENYYFGLSILPLSILFGILCLAMIKETYQSTPFNSDEDSEPLSYQL